MEFWFIFWLLPKTTILLLSGCPSVQISWCIQTFNSVGSCSFWSEIVTSISSQVSSSWTAGMKGECNMTLCSPLPLFSFPTVELSSVDAGLEAWPRPGNRQHCGDESGRADATDGSLRGQSDQRGTLLYGFNVQHFTWFSHTNMKIPQPQLTPNIYAWHNGFCIFTYFFPLFFQQDFVHFWALI